MSPRCEQLRVLAELEERLHVRPQLVQERQRGVQLRLASSSAASSTPWDSAIFAIVSGASKIAIESS